MHINVFSPRSYTRDTEGDDADVYPVDSRIVILINTKTGLRANISNLLLMPNPLELQALALHFLLKDGLNVNDADQTKAIALAHLLSGTKIPTENGRENISKSSIKATFDEMWQQQDEHYLANLRILLQSFKPFEVSSSGTMRSTIQAIEREIAKTEIRLKA